MSALDDKKRELKALVSCAVQELYGLNCDFEIVRPRSRGNGDLSATAALALGGALKRPPIEIGREIVKKITMPPGERAEVMGKGFINFFLRSDFLLSELRADLSPMELSLPELSDPRFFELHTVARLSSVLRTQGTPPDGSEQLELLTSGPETRLLWAIFGGDKNELSAAALDFYDRVGLRSGYPPLSMARYILLGNAVKALATEMEELL